MPAQLHLVLAETKEGQLGVPLDDVGVEAERYLLVMVELVGLQLGCAVD